MGIFGGGKPEKSGKHGGNAHDDEAGYFDSPTENVSLKAPPPAQAAVPTIEEKPPTPSFGINSAIQLMRSLPLEKNVELVVTVIKTTLESMRVRVPDIIADAASKLSDLERRVETLSKEIADYEREIAQRKEQIASLEADHRETSEVKQRLELAEQSGGDKARAQARS